MTNPNKYTMLDFFENRSILLTGATGFVGKAVLETILRCLPGVKVVYILIREKRGKSPQSRLEDLLENSLFDKVKKEKQNIRNKVIPLKGSLTEKQLALSECDLNTIQNDVSIVLHAAANVNFESSISDSIKDNVMGTINLLKLCQQIENLVGFVHVSTAYTNCDSLDANIKEEVYPISNSYINFLKPHLRSLVGSLGSKPNSYVYSKAVAENVVQAFAAEYKIPSCIVRPSIVCCSFRDPIPGWVDGYGGFNGNLLAIMSGLLNIAYCKPDVIMDIIPVDVVATAVVAAGWNTAMNKNFKVYNCVSGPFTRNTLSVNMKIFLNAARQYPLENAIFYPDLQLTNSKIWWIICTFWKQLLPALTLDTISSLSSALCKLFNWSAFETRSSEQRIKLMRLQKRIIRVQNAQRYFTFKQWFFDIGNVTDLETKLNKNIPTDVQSQWGLTIRNMDWNQYVRDYCLGVRRFLMKQSDSSISAAVKRASKQYLIGKLLKLIAILILGTVSVFSVFHVYGLKSSDTHIPK